MKIDVSDSPIARHDDFLAPRLAGFGIFCLSGKNDHILMWSHYADSHKGICFGFKDNLTGYIPNEAPLYDSDIIYENEHPYIEIYNDFSAGRAYASNDQFKNFAEMSHDLLDAALTKKHIDWQYEEETRIISEEGPGPRTFKPEGLSNVVLGMNISPEDEQLIKTLLEHKKWEHVKLSKAHASRAELGIKIIPIQ